MNKRILSPIYWKEKEVEYAMEGLFELPNMRKEGGLKRNAVLIGKSLACRAIAVFPFLPLVAPVVYAEYKFRDSETIKNMEKNIQQSLLKKGYKSELVKQIEFGKRPSLFPDLDSLFS